MSSTSSASHPAQPVTPARGQVGSWTYPQFLVKLYSNEWVCALLILAFTRLFVLAGAFYGGNLITRQQPAYDKGWLAEASLMWDATFYWGIAYHHYQYDPAAPGGSSISFAPLYPFLIDAVQGLLRFVTGGWDWGNERFGAYIAAGLLISNISFFVALALLVRFLRPRLGNGGALMVAFGLASLPTAFFFSAMYTEALFLMLVVASFVMAHSQWRWKWLGVGLVGMLACLAKFAGALLLPVFLVDYLAQQGWQWRRVRPDLLWLGLIPVGIAIYLGFLWWRFGDPLAVNDSMLKGWNHKASFFFDTYRDNALELWDSIQGRFPPGEDQVLRFGNGSRVWKVLDIAMPPLLLVGAFLARKKLLASEWVWLVLGILYPLSTNITFSLARYVLPLWPGLLWLGTIKSRYRWIAMPLIMASLVLMAWCAARYSSARWIG